MNDCKDCVHNPVCKMWRRSETLDAYSYSTGGFGEECPVFAPTIDPEELRPKGEWVLGHVEPGYFTPGGNRPWLCSRCRKVISWRLDEPKENYCPNCGAKMRGAEE